MLTTRRNWTRVMALALAAGCLAVPAALAQSTTQGAIGGTVFDPSGAVVSHASISIHNDGTNAEKVLTSDESGSFVAPLVEPGTYTVKVTASGFETFEADRVIVQVGQTTTLLPHLLTGTATTTVQVTSEAPVLNFVSPDFSEVINQTTIANVPINNRRWSALALSTPGVVPDTSGFGLVSVRGISTLLNNVQIDGADDNQAYYSEERGRTREAYSTSGSAVQEFQMNTGVYSAEYGRAAGGVINSVTKSGTNNLHGEAYFYDRESNWNAKNPYTKLTTLVNGVNTTSVVKPKDLRKIYGFTMGGPLIKDKLFWMYTYDQHSRIFPAISTPSIPSTFYALPDAATATGGNSFVQANGNTYTCNTATGYAQPTGTTTAAASTIDAQVCTMAARLGMTYSGATSTYGTGLAGLTTDLGLIPRSGYQEINTPKLDWQVNQKNRVSFLFHRLRWDSPGGVQTSNPVFYGLDTTGTDFVKLDYGVTKLSSQLSSTISNEILYQYGRELNDEGQMPFTSYTKSNLIGANGNVPQVVFASTAGTLTFGSPYYSYRPVYPDERKWQVEDTVYWAHGNHTIKFGADLLHNADLQVNTFESNGVFNYAYISTYLTDLYLSQHGGSGVCDNAATGNSTANSGTGQVAGVAGTDAYPCYTSFVQGFGPPSFGVKTFDYGIFAQDNWKFSPRLTLELGVRYDQEMLPAEPAAYVNAAVPQTANHPSDKNNLGPRVGFAWDPYGTGKTILRGGFGLYYGRIPNAVILNAQLNTATSQAQYTTTFKGQGTSSVPAGPIFPNIKAAAATGPVSPAIEYLDKNLQDPMVEEYDLILQQQLGKGTVLSVSYLGAMGRELTNFIDFNLAPPVNVNITVTDTTGKGPLAPGTYTVPTFTSYLTSGTSFGAITDVISNINSSYNALVGEIQNHTLHSIQFDASYTWSHALDFSQNATTTTATAGENWLDPYGNPRANYGNSNYNTPNHLVGYVVYNLPNLVGRKSWASYVANDWSIDDSFNAGSGLPWSIGVSGFNSTGAVLSGWNGSGVTSYIPLIGRNTQKYPKHVVDDLRVQKGIRFTERYQLDLLCNVFNVANHQNIDGLNTTGYTLSKGTATFNTSGGNPTVGTVSSSNSSGFLFTPRQLELAAKFHF
jgi:hypothetical protein